MKSQGGISYSNAAVAACPKHLLQFAVDQRYDDYTSVDHAVWRFIMRQNTFFLREYAHKVYFQGLLNTGISFESIRITCSASAKSAQERCLQRKISSCIKRSGTCRS